MTEIAIRQVRARELEAFAEQALRAAAPGEVVPISLRRARAQSRNPFADEADVGLIVAQRGTECVGYLGLLPGRARIAGRVQPVHWMTTWYVSPELRGQRVGYRMFEAARALGYDLFGTAFSGSAERVMRAAGFRGFGPVHFGVLDLRRVVPWTAPLVLARRRLRKAGREQGRAAGWARRADRALGRPAKDALLGLLMRGFRAGARGVSWEVVDAVEPLDGDEQRGDRFLRGADVVNWMLRYPWVGEERYEPGDEHYYFSSVRHLFRRRALRFAGSAGERLGFAVVSAATVRERRVVRVLDHQLRGDAAFDAAVLAALHFAREVEADSVVLPDSFLPRLRRSRLARLLLRRERRGYLFLPAEAEGEVARGVPGLQLDYCDGDTAFNA